MATPRVPRSLLQNVIEKNTTTFTRKRTTQTVTESGTTDQSVTTADVELYVTEENNARQQLPHGESRGQSLNILAAPSTDVQDGDEIDYGDNTWELTVSNVPNEIDPDYLEIVAERADTA